MKKLYEKPEIELINFLPQDQITGDLDGDDIVDGSGDIGEW